MSTTQVSAKVTMQELIERVAQLEAQVASLIEGQKSKTTSTGKEMTDDDARNILFGDLATKKHKEAAEALGLTYGQVYSCRLAFTFKAIHKEMADKKITNTWAK